MTSWVGYAMRFKSYERFFEFVSVSVILLKSGSRMTYFPAFNHIENEFFSPLLLLLLFRFLLLTSVPMLEVVVRKSHTAKSGAYASEREDVVECRIKQEKESILSFCLKSFKSFLLHDFESENSRIYNCIYTNGVVDAWYTVSCLLQQIQKKTVIHWCY